MTISVLIVDDQPLARAGLSTIVEAESDLDVIGTSADGEAAVEDALMLQPNVILMDIRMPVLDGIAATRRILAQQQCAIVLITTFDDEEYLRDGIAAGASGFLLKDADPPLVYAAIRSAHRGDALIDPAMTRLLFTREGGPASDADMKRLASLSAREKEVLRGLARGSSNIELASELFVSSATIKTHISNVLTKTDSRTRVQAAAFAYESGFVRPGWLSN